MSAGPGLELQPHAHGWQQASMPTGSGLLPCPVERVRSAGQIGTCCWMFFSRWTKEDTSSAEPGRLNAAERPHRGMEDRLVRLVSVLAADGVGALRCVWGAGDGEFMLFTRVCIRLLGARSSSVSKVLARGEGGSRWTLGGSV